MRPPQLHALDVDPLTDPTQIEVLSLPSGAKLMACLPPAANVFVIAQQYNVYVQRASSAILIGTIASTVTVSAFIYLITEGLLPLN